MASEDAAVVVSLRANLKDYEAALKSAVRATERAATAAEKTLTNIGKKAPAGTAITQNFQKSSAQMVNDARVMQFQLNDIFSGIASGQGIRAVQQQLGQIAQQLGGGGMAAAGRTLGTAMIGMINPINLAVVAFGVLATVAASYFTSAEEDAEKATKELEKQADTLDKLAEKYGALFPELKRAADQLREQADAAGLAAAKEKALTAAYEDTQKAMATQSEGMTEIISMLEAMGAPINDLVALQNAFSDLADAVDEHRASVEDAQPLVKALDGIIENGSGKVVELATAIRTQLVAAFNELGRAADSAAEIMRNATETGRTMPLVGTDVILGRQAQNAFKTPETSRELLRNRAASKEIAATFDDLTDEMAVGLAKLFAILPESARITSGVRSRAKQTQLYADYKAGRGGLAAPPGRSLHEIGAAVDIGQGVSMEELRAAVKLVPELEQLDAVSESIYQRDKVHVQLKGARRKVDKDAADEAVRTAEQQAKAAAQAQENLANYLVSLDEQASLQNRINDINANTALTAEQKAIAIEVETELQKAMNLAKQNNITLSEKEIELIRRKAVANAQATLGATALADAERAAAKSAQENAQAAQQFSQQISQMAQSAIGGLVNDLRNGVEAGEAFNNMLSRILDSLIQMSLQSLFSPAGGGGILSGLFGAAQSGGIVGKTAFPQRRVSPLVFAGAPHFAKGGMVGLRSGEVPIIAHRGEMIVPKGMVGKGNTSINNQLGPVSIDMAGTGLVAAGPEQAKQMGENIRKIIAGEMVRESRPGGLLRRVPT